MRRMIKSLSYRAIDQGLRLPELTDVSSYIQLSRTIDLIRSQNVNLVLDVGANRGWYAYHLRQAGYKGPLISFEPIAHEFAHIQELSKGDELWTAHNMALGEENEQKSFNMIVAGGDANQTVLSSFLEPVEDLGNKSEKVTVTMRRLDSVLAELFPHDLAGKRIFLKMDTQGYDLSVLAGATDVMDQIVLIQSEVSVRPLYVGMPPYTDSLARFHAAGFSLADLFVVNRTRDGNILEYDCLMQRSEP